MFLIATLRFRSSSTRSGTSCNLTGALDKHASATAVHHHLCHARIQQQMLDRTHERQDALEAAHSAPSRHVIEVAGLHVQVVRLQVAVRRRLRVQPVVRQHHRLGVLQLAEDLGLEHVVQLEGVVLARRHGGLGRRGASGQQRHAGVLAGFRELIRRLQALGTAAQFGRDFRGELVGRGEEDLGAETLEECAPGLLAMDGRPQGADALRRDDRNQPGLPAQCERAFVAGWVGVAGRRKRVVFVTDEQDVAPCLCSARLQSGRCAKARRAESPVSA